VVLRHSKQVERTGLPTKTVGKCVSHVRRSVRGRFPSTRCLRLVKNRCFCFCFYLVFFNPISRFSGRAVVRSVRVTWVSQKKKKPNQKKKKKTATTTTKSYIDGLVEKCPTRLTYIRFKRCSDRNNNKITYETESHDSVNVFLHLFQRILFLTIPTIIDNMQFNAFIINFVRRPQCIRYSHGVVGFTNIFSTTNYVIPCGDTQTESCERTIRSSDSRNVYYI